MPFLKKPSIEFFSVMDNCNFVISPTCAEGQPGSIIESMAHGLIPIVSKEANIDTKDFGITLQDNSVEQIVSVIRDVSQKPIEWCKHKSALTIEEVQNCYSPEQFLENMKKTYPNTNTNKERIKIKGDCVESNSNLKLDGTSRVIREPGIRKTALKGSRASNT